MLDRMLGSASSVVRGNFGIYDGGVELRKFLWKNIGVTF